MNDGGFLHSVRALPRRRHMTHNTSFFHLPIEIYRERCSPQRRYLGITRLLLSLTSTALTTSCTTSRPLVSPPTSVPREPVNSRADLSGLTSVNQQSIFSPGQLEYAIQVQAVVQALPPDSMHTPDSTHTVAAATMMFETNSPNKITATISIDSIHQSIQGTASESLPRQYFQFSINPEGTLISSQRDRVNTEEKCTAHTQQAPFSGFELLPHIPIPLRPTWTDTTDVHTCRDGLSILFHRISNYQHISEDSANRITRSTQVVVTGNGKQWNQSVNVAGTGLAVDTIWLSSSGTLRLQQIRGSSHLDLTFRSPLRIQHFEQTASLFITHQ